MPATAGRVRMPANNRLSVSDSLRTSEIWQKSVGYDPYAPDKPFTKDIEDSEVNDKAKGLFALARLTGNSSSVTPGACRKCGQVGHLPYQCRNSTASLNGKAAASRLGEESDSEEEEEEEEEVAVAPPPSDSSSESASDRRSKRKKRKSDGSARTKYRRKSSKSESHSRRRSERDVSTSESPSSSDEDRKHKQRKASSEQNRKHKQRKTESRSKKRRS